MMRHFLSYCAVLHWACACCALAQATFQMGNYASFGVDAPIFDWQGIPLEGTNYLAELYGGLGPDALAAAVDERTPGERVTARFVAPGYFRPAYPYVAIPSVGECHWGWLQVRAWDARLGATYEAVAGRGLGGYGESPLFYARGGGGACLSIPTPLLGLRSFRLRPPTGAVLMRGVRRQGDQVVLEWNPGFQRYQPQRTATLDKPWEDLGELTTATSVTNSINSKTQFFRVIGFLE